MRERNRGGRDKGGEMRREGGENEEEGGEGERGERSVMGYNPSHFSITHHTSLSSLYIIQRHTCRIVEGGGRGGEIREKGGEWEREER